MKKDIKKKAILVLENGATYEGVSCSVETERIAPVTFYTGVVGYEEVITNPANAGKIIVMTYPNIGNYGVANKFQESKHCWVEGMIIKENSRITSNWQAECDFTDFIRQNKIPVFEAMDTRSIMIELRQTGEQFGIISTRDFNPQRLKRKIRQGKKELDFIKKISTKKIIQGAVKGKRIGIIDIGVTNSLLNQLIKLRCKPILIPYQAESFDILRLRVSKIIISDGPEMDKSSYIVADTVEQLLGKLPILGIGTGCQILAVALGAKIKRMHLGHHGVNYPIVEPKSFKGEISVQNHSCVINEATIKNKGIEVTWRNLNDKTIEGIQNKRLKAYGFQFYPAPPGVGEVNQILKELVNA